VNTIVDNTMILFRLKAYAYIKLSMDNFGVEPTYDEFMCNVEAALNGDDNLFTVSDEVLAWYNPKAIGAVWSSIGVTTTAECDEPVHISQCTFLSNGFHYEESLACWLPKPDTTKVLNSLMYASGVDDVRWHLLRALALRIDSYGNPELRDILSKYIDFLQSEYKDQMYGSVKGLEMVDIYNVWKSDTWIRALYSGNESNTSEISVPQGQLWEEITCCAAA
jgi:hypothetical protein